MKVTTKLIDHMTAVRRDKGWSYAEMARRTGLSWEIFRKLENVLVSEIREDSTGAICKLLGINMDQLRDIAEGTRPVPPPPCNPDVRAAEALLRWVRKDDRRSAAIRAMGFKGDL